MVGARKDGGREGGRKRRVGGREQGEGERKENHYTAHSDFLYRPL